METNVSNEEFIRAVKDRQILWDYSHPGFKNKVRKEKLWKEIENEYGLSTHECKQKWKFLRNTYCRKNKNSTDWKHSQDMYFLLPLMGEKSDMFDDDSDQEVSSFSSREIDLEASHLDPIEAKPKPQKKNVSITPQFIQEVQQREMIWNCHNPSFKIDELRKSAWEEISSIVGLTIKSCKSKWRCLMVYMARECANQPINSAWPYFNDLQFIRPFLGDVKRKSDENQSSEASPSSTLDSQNGFAKILIAEVERHPTIWNTTHEDNKSVNKKLLVWENVAATLQTPVEQCKKKWRSLRDIFARSFAKNPDINTNNWPHFKQLIFLAPYLQGKNLGFAKLFENNEGSDVDESLSHDSNHIKVKTEKLDIPEFSNDDFIVAMQTQPVLWDLNFENYKNLKVRHVAWEAVSYNIGISVTECKKKWRSLRDSFVRSYSKNPDVNSNQWDHFHQMLFLVPFIGANKSILEKSVEHIEDTDAEQSLPSSVRRDSDNIEEKTETQEEVKDFATEMFIEEMKKQPTLWDQSNDDYRNIKLRLIAWKVVADHIGLSVANCKRKWNVLRDTFVRNFIRLSDEEEINWKFYNQMTFLEPHVRNRKHRNVARISVENIKCEEDTYSESSESEAEESQNNLSEINDSRKAREIREMKVLQFIRAIKQRELLWDIRNAEYRTSNLRLQCWEEIGALMSYSVDDCKRKWKTLRDAFNRTYNKPIKEEEKTWKFYGEMQFLMRNIDSRVGETSLLDDFDTSDVKIKVEVDDIGFARIYEVKQNNECDMTVTKSLEDFAVEEFIELVRQNQVLWDTNHEDYKIPEVRLEKWKEIASHFGCSIKECKKKWKALRDSFVRNYFKAVDEKYINWTYYKQMKFLGPHVKYKQGSYLVGDIDVNDRLEEECDAIEDKQSDVVKKFSAKDFILEIKKHRILWDVNDENCKSKQSILQAWKEVASHFSLSMLDCRRKWSTLMSAFTREYAKHPDNTVWEHFEEMDFLLPYLQANVDTTNYVKVEDGFSFNDFIEEDNFPEICEIANDKGKDNGLFEKMVECGPSAFAQRVESITHIARNCVPIKRRKPSVGSSDGEHDEFYHSLKQKMKKLPSKTRRDAKAHINAYLNVIAATTNNYN